MAISYICPHCGARSASPKRKHESSLAAELVIWVLCILIGAFTGLWLAMVFALVFSLWRQFAKVGRICPDCSQDGMIPLESPRGQELAEKYPG